MSLYFVCIIVALILSILAAVPVPSRVGLFPLAFAFFMLALILQTWHPLIR